MDGRTVYNWEKRIGNGLKWKDRKQKRSLPKQKNEQMDMAKKTIDAGTKEYGYETDKWTLKRNQSVIKKKFNGYYGLLQVYNILHDHVRSA